MMNHSTAGEEVKPDHQDILERYESLCARVWSDGSVRVCEDRRMMEEAEWMVFSREEERHTFTLLPFYTTVNNLITTHNNTSNIPPNITPNINSTPNFTPNITDKANITPTSVYLLQRLSKAFEILELLCINLFLFPWKKEIKSLKKFTASFVYYIEAFLPSDAVLRVLQHIGYDTETHTEYRLSHSANPNRAKTMGLELFLARLECQRLIQRMSQKSEGLHIISRLRSSETNQEEPEIHAAPNRVLEVDRKQTHNFLFPSEQCLTLPDQEKSQRGSLEHGAILSEDKSILEMQKDYPDLAFRQRPIFKSSIKMKRDVKFSREPSHAEAALEPHEEQQLCIEASSHSPGFSHTTDTSVTGLAEMMDKLKLKEFPRDERLKCPVEETNQTAPILCSPTHHSTTSDPLQQHHITTKPPQSFYIPNLENGSATTPPAEPQENIHSISKAGTEQDLHSALEIL